MKNFLGAKNWAISVFFFTLTLIYAQEAKARPEYALQTKQNCTACHVSAWGSGPRTAYGKYFGSFGFPQAKTSASDVYYGDMKSIAYFPKAMAKYGGGVSLMEAAGSANVPIIDNENDSELRAVATYNAAPISAGAREVYFRWRPHADENSPLGLVTVGRFNVPFGYLTDEHRTYTKIESNSTLNNFDTGVAVSGGFLPSLHYDLAMVNDLQGANFFSAGDVPYGQVFNLRWNQPGLPFLLGASEEYEHLVNSPQPSAYSLYTAFDFDQITSKKVHLMLMGEYVVAKNWNSSTINPGLGSFFIPATATDYQTQINNTQSQGYFIEAKYYINSRFAPYYKFDYLALDRQFLADAFSRHGVGLETHLNSNLTLDARYEKATVGHPEIVGSDALAAQDDFLLMMRLWL